MSRTAFYAPMKPPDHPTPSGDRLIARLTLRALELAGHVPYLASRLRTLDIEGDAGEQARLAGAAEAEVGRILDGPAPARWVTYHCHYKAPDLIGPAVAARLGIPYAITEPSISPRRREGPWAGFAARSEAAIAVADRLFWTTERDRPALDAAGHAAKMVHLSAFLDPGPEPAPKAPSGTLRLVTVAMMRRGDKLESYRRLAAALPHLPGPWELIVIGDGAARGEVEPLLRGAGFLGAIDDPAVIRGALEAADVCLWPGVGEGVGMVWLEAMAAGTPVAAEDGPAARALIPPAAGCLAPPADPRALAGAVIAARGRAPRAHVLARHSLDAAAAILREHLP